VRSRTSAEDDKEDRITAKVSNINLKGSTCKREKERNRGELLQLVVDGQPKLQGGQPLWLVLTTKMPAVIGMELLAR
jgi:hypothetical protein